MKLSILVTHRYQASVVRSHSTIYSSPHTPPAYDKVFARAEREQPTNPAYPEPLKLAFGNKYEATDLIMLKRDKVVALRDMLNEVLSDWPEEKEKA